MVKSLIKPINWHSGYPSTLWDDNRTYEINRPLNLNSNLAVPFYLTPTSVLPTTTPHSSLEAARKPLNSRYTTSWLAMLSLFSRGNKDAIPIFTRRYRRLCFEIDTPCLIKLIKTINFKRSILRIFSTFFSSCETLIPLLCFIQL